MKRVVFAPGGKAHLCETLGWAVVYYLRSLCGYTLGESVVWEDDKAVLCETCRLAAARRAGGEG